MAGDSIPRQGKVKKKPTKGSARTLTGIVIVVAMVLVGGGLAYLVLSTSDGRAGFVLYSGSPVLTLDPGDALDIGSRLPVENIYDTLVREDSDGTGNTRPCLSTAWSVSEDGLWYNFTLRQGVVFSNGNEFDASDVLFTIERVVRMGSPATGSSTLISDCVNLSQTKVLGDSSISIRLNRPTPAFLSRISQAFPMAILDREYTLSHYSADDLYAHDFMREHPMGTGPFKLEGWNVGKELALVRNSEYWGVWEQDNINRVVVRYEPDAQLRLEAVRDGRADAADIPGDLRDEAVAIHAIGLVNSQSANIEIVAMNARPGTGSQPFMMNEGVRAAFSYAFDYENISSEVYDDTSSPLLGCLADSMPYARESQPRKGYSFDLGKASELLNSSGYLLDSRGFRFNGSAIKLFFEPGDALRAAVASAFASDLARLGAKVNVQASDRPGTIVNDAWDMYLASFRPWYLDPEYYVTALAVSSDHGGDVFRTGIKNDAVDYASECASTALNSSSRLSNYSAVWQQLNAYPNMIYVAQPTMTYAVGVHVDFFSVDPVTSLDLLSVHMA